MSYNAYHANHKVWDHIGNITPNVEYSEPHRPHGEYIPASWLPVGRWDKRMEEYIVVSAGKVVSFDATGRIVPAGFKVAFAKAAGTVLSYSANDVTDLTTNLVTGQPVSAPVNYTAAQVLAGLIARGLLDAGQTADEFISAPVGVAPQNYFAWAGGDGFNPAQYKKHNHNLQHRVPVLCKYVVEMPLVPADVATMDLTLSTAIAGVPIVDWSDPNPDGAWFDSTALSLTTRYASDVAAGDDVIALNFGVKALAKSTVITPLTLTAAFSREVQSIGELTAAGDYFVDYDVGVILIYAAGGAVVPGAFAAGSITYFHYEGVPTSVSTFACAVGNLQPGMYVTMDENSNFVPAKEFVAGDVVVAAPGDPTDAELATIMNQVLAAKGDVIGQVLDMEVHPKDYLERVRTAYPQLGVLDRMPGTASQGMPTAITYAGGANKTVRILLLK